MHILITGASSGIGLSTAAKLFQSGHQLSLCSRSTDSLNAFNAEKLEGKAFVGSCDVRDIESVRAFTKSAVQKHGTIDVLVNNAGLGKFNRLDEAPIEEWHEMMDTNVKGLLNCIHAVLPGMKEQESGHIINLGSVASHNVFPNSGVYCASKHAVLAISEGLRIECSAYLKVTTISPGAVNTNFIYKTENEELKNQMEASFVNGMTPEMIADQIDYVVGYSGKATISEIIIRPNKQKS